MQLPILKTIERVPAGLILVPMFLTSILTTFCPGVLSLGGLSTALFSGSATEALIALLILLAVDKLLLRRPGYAAVAYTSIPGVAVTFPAAIAAALPQYAPYVTAATGQIALAMALSNVLTIFLTRASLRLWGDGKPGQSG